LTQNIPSKQWELLPASPPGAIEGNDIPPVVANILHRRGLATKAEIDSFLNPPSSSFHDPYLLPDMDKAISRLRKAIENGETIGIYGDFDVDGVSATALLATAFRNMGTKVIPYIPHRIQEGHGPNGKGIMTLAQQGCSIMITVDCGVTSSTEVDLANSLGIDTIITDHHTPLPPLPNAHAVVNPKLPACLYPFPHLAGAGLAFKLAQALYEQMGQRWDTHLTSLAAIGTIADIAPLIGENRSLVREGLRHLASTRNPGLLALYERARIKPAVIDIETVGFAISPRLNASGRLDHGLISYRLLTTESDSEASALSEHIENLNNQRRQLAAEAITAAMEQVLAHDSVPSILLVGQDWYTPGIVGLVASKLVEEFRRPVVAMCLEKDLIRASARSIPQFDLVDSFTRCQDLFTKFGGHPQAAGFTMPSGNVDQLKERLLRLANQELQNLDLRPIILIDAEVPVSNLVGEVYQWIKRLEPFGKDNPRPIFLSRRVKVEEVRRMGHLGQHLRLKLNESGKRFNAIALQIGDIWVNGTTSLDIVYTLTTDRWGNTEAILLRVLDFRPSST
jgi:single-stranded-DNA-specific exonuclease